VVKAAFAQRRKTLRNTLKAAGYQNLETVERNIGLDLQRRGETLSLEEFAALANVLVLMDQEVLRR
jgi:16S rRNA (adenine1518-N6/adenine1519-N6)-dimethyltransferase